MFSYKGIGILGVHLLPEESWIISLRSLPGCSPHDSQGTCKAGEGMDWERGGEAELSKGQKVTKNLEY